MPVPTTTTIPSSRSASLSNSKSCSLASSSSNSSVGNRDVTPQCRIGTSSSKTGHMVDNLRVQRPEDVSKLWQSDALAPHSITIELDRQTALSVPLLSSDESYTPRTVVIQLGSSIDTLTDFTTVNCEGSQGWVCVDLGGSHLREGL